MKNVLSYCLQILHLSRVSSSPAGSTTGACTKEEGIANVAVSWQIAGAYPGAQKLASVGRVLLLFMSESRVAHLRPVKNFRRWRSPSSL